MTWVNGDIGAAPLVPSDELPSVTQLHRGPVRSPLADGAFVRSA